MGDQDNPSSQLRIIQREVIGALPRGWHSLTYPSWGLEGIV